MQDLLNSRNRGDVAFRDKDFKTAIDCYTQVIFCSDVIDLKLIKIYCASFSHTHSDWSWIRLQFVDVGTMMSPTVLARRSLAYLLSGQAEVALHDAMQAEYVRPEWPTAFCLQAAALSTLGLGTDAKNMLKEGTVLDMKQQNHYYHWSPPLVLSHCSRFVSPCLLYLSEFGSELELCYNHHRTTLMTFLKSYILYEPV